MLTEVTESSRIVLFYFSALLLEELACDFFLTPIYPFPSEPFCFSISAWDSRSDLYWIDY